MKTNLCDGDVVDDGNPKINAIGYVNDRLGGKFSDCCSESEFERPHKLTVLGKRDGHMYLWVCQPRILAIV